MIDPLIKDQSMDELIIGTINQLPKVLQNEIWEYVRGDRAFWKSKFEACVMDTEWVISFRNSGREHGQWLDIKEEVRLMEMCVYFPYLDDGSIADKRGWPMSHYNPDWRSMDDLPHNLIH